jgi:hypothetical protein
MVAVLGVCGLPGAGKSTIASEICTPMPNPKLVSCTSVLDYITHIIAVGFPTDDRGDIRTRVDVLLREMIDPDYVRICDKMLVYENVYERADIEPAHAREIFYSYGVKQIVAALFGFSWNIVCYDRKARESVLTKRSYSACPRMTARQALQYVGTNIFRDRFHPDTWSNITSHLIENIRADVVFVTDVRYRNEATALRNGLNKLNKLNGQIMLVYRSIDDLRLTEEMRASQHSSVWSFLEFQDLVNYHVRNDITVADLVASVRDIIACM